MPTGLRSRSRTRLVRATSAVVMAAGLVLTTATTSAVGATALSPVRNLVATASGDAATVSWQAPASGTVARYVVEAHRTDYYNETYPDFGARVVTGSTTSMTWDGLPLNQSVYFTVQPIGPDGPYGLSGTPGPFNSTANVTPSNSYCPATQADCVVVNTSDSLGAEQHVGSGLLHGTVPAGNKWVSALNLNSWRIEAVNPTQYRQATAFVAPQNVIELLSDAWYAATIKGSYVADPWANWTVYTNFIAATVKAAEQAGENPIWEIQNEPEGYPYSPSQPPTRALVDMQYLKAYQAIKSVDPNARVIGPSITYQYQNLNAPWYVDLKTFIPFAAANGMKLYAIAWHDNSDSVDQNPLSYYEMPQELRDEAEVVHELIAENPGIGSPKLFVDENSSAAGQFIPGFAAGYFAAEEQAGIDEANRACWPYPGSTDASTCFQANLGELLNSDGNPNASYWTMVDYAAMSGMRVASESSDINLSSLAVTDSSGVTRILLGRHQTCSQPTTGSYCNGPTALPAPVATTVQVLLPTSASSATVQIQEMANSRADVPTAPATTTSTVPVSGGLATVSIPSFGDGEAYFVTVTPDSTAGAAPTSGDVNTTEVPAASGTSVATRVLPIGGDNQSAKVLQPYGQSLVALATDQYGNPLANTQVTFTLPGARYGMFGSGSTSATVTTDANGVATSPAIRAMLQTGQWTATATVTSVASRPTAWFGMTTTR